MGAMEMVHADAICEPIWLLGAGPPQALGPPARWGCLAASTHQPLAAACLFPHPFNKFHEDSLSASPSEAKHQSASCSENRASISMDAQEQHVRSAEHCLDAVAFVPRVAQGKDL